MPPERARPSSSDPTVRAQAARDPGLSAAELAPSSRPACRAATSTSRATGAARPDPEAALRLARARRRAQWLGWLVAPIALCAIVAGVSLIRNGPIAVPLVAISSVAALLIAWLLISILFPAHLDRDCPECDGSSLEPLDPSSFQGVRCPDCGWQDSERSGYLIAEAQGRIAPRSERDSRSAP